MVMTPCFRASVRPAMAVSTGCSNCVISTFDVAMVRSAAATSAGESFAAAPLSTMMALLPVSVETKMKAAPVGNLSSITTEVVSMPSAAQAFCAISPKVSRPMRVMIRASPPARAAAMA